MTGHSRSLPHFEYALICSKYSAAKCTYAKCWYIMSQMMVVQSNLSVKWLRPIQFTTAEPQWPLASSRCCCIKRACVNSSYFSRTANKCVCDVVWKGKTSFHQNKTMNLFCHQKAHANCIVWHYQL